MRASASEAASSFKDATIFLEKYVSPARHIEVQIVADSHGNVRAFGERDQQSRAQRITGTGGIDDGARGGGRLLHPAELR